MLEVDRSERRSGRLRHQRRRDADSRVGDGSERRQDADGALDSDAPAHAVKGAGNEVTRTWSEQVVEAFEASGLAHELVVFEDE